MNGERITGSFYEKELQETSQEKCTTEKVLKRKKNVQQKKYLKEKVINCMSNGKGMIIALIVGSIKKTSYKNESILPHAV